MTYFALQEDAKLNHLVRIPGALERFLLISILSRALTWHKNIMTNVQLYMQNSARNNATSQ